MHLDEGPIIAQDSIPVRSNGTFKKIGAAGQKLEANLVKGVKLYLTKKLAVFWEV